MGGYSAGQGGGLAKSYNFKTDKPFRCYIKTIQVKKGWAGSITREIILIQEEE